MGDVDGDSRRVSRARAQYARRQADGMRPSRRPSSFFRSFASSVTATTSRPKAPRAAASAAAAAAALLAARPPPEGYSMTRRPRSLRCLARSWAGNLVLVLLVAAACLSGGCVLNGDFGRIRPELVGDNMHDWVGRDAVARIGGPVSEFRTTDQERELRDRAYALIEPPYNRGRWDSVLREYGLRQRSGESGRRSIAPNISTSCTRSIAAPRRRPMRRSSPTRATTSSGCSRSSPSPAASPTWTGGARESLVHVSNLNPRERGNAIARNNENAAIIAWVCRRAEGARCVLSLRARTAGGGGAGVGCGGSRSRHRSAGDAGRGSIAASAAAWWRCAGEGEHREAPGLVQ